MPRRGKSISAASNSAASVRVPAAELLPSLLTRASNSGLPLARSLMQAPPVAGG
jgi:hypothetical protein